MYTPHPSTTTPTNGIVYAAKNGRAIIWSTVRRSEGSGVTAASTNATNGADHALASIGGMPWVVMSTRARIGGCSAYLLGN